MHYSWNFAFLEEVVRGHISWVLRQGQHIQPHIPDKLLHSYVLMTLGIVLLIIKDQNYALLFLVHLLSFEDDRHFSDIWFHKYCSSASQSKQMLVFHAFVFIPSTQSGRAYLHLVVLGELMILFSKGQLLTYNQ